MIDKLARKLGARGTAQKLRAELVAFGIDESSTICSDAGSEIKVEVFDGTTMICTRPQNPEGL